MDRKTCISKYELIINVWEKEHVSEIGRRKEITILVFTNRFSVPKAMLIYSDDQLTTKEVK